MISPLPHDVLSDVLADFGPDASPFPILDRAFDAVERALARLGVGNPARLRSPRPVEEALSRTALPEGTLLVVDPAEWRAAEADIEDTVKDERLGGSLFVSLPHLDDLPDRARGLRELAVTAPTFGFNPSLKPLPAARLGRLKQVPLPLNLRRYRFLLADTPGFRVVCISRDVPGGGAVGLWSGNAYVVDEVQRVLAAAATAAGHQVPAPAGDVPVGIEGLASPEDVWRQARELRAHRVVRKAELREIARAAALRGVALRREREIQRQAAAR